MSLDEMRAGEYLGTVLAPMCTVFASITVIDPFAADPAAGGA